MGMPGFPGLNGIPVSVVVLSSGFQCIFIVVCLHMNICLQPLEWQDLMK